MLQLLQLYAEPIPFHVVQSLINSIVNMIPEATHLQKYSLFYGNLFNCPVGRRVRTCPIYPLEYMTFEERFNWFNQLSPEEKDNILRHHTSCVCRRGTEEVW
jgi:hypothetical protein